MDADRAIQLVPAASKITMPQSGCVKLFSFKAVTMYAWYERRAHPVEPLSAVHVVRAGLCGPFVIIFCLQRIAFTTSAIGRSAKNAVAATGKARGVSGGLARGELTRCTPRRRTREQEHMYVYSLLLHRLRAL